MRIGLLGGSFDPIHIGHIEIASKAIEELHLDAFYFIPTKNNPWKDTKSASDIDRVNMIKAAIGSREDMSVETIEVDRKDDEKNYTIDTIHSLQKLHPENDYYFLMGMDQACAFDKWVSAKEISELVQLVAFNRGGYPSTSDNLEKYHFIKMDNLEITASSTAIREGDLSKLDSNVLRYISSHGLYLDTMIKPRMREKRYLHSLSVAKLTAEFAKNNGLDPLKGYIAGVMHDVAKEMDGDLSRELMMKYYPEFIESSRPVWHQWISAYVCKNEFLIEDEEILKAIEDHTTASTNISKLGKCLYCADKLDPLRGYDVKADIEICNRDIDEGFRNSLQSFYDFSKEKGRPIDPVFFDIYKKFVTGE